GSPSSPPSSSLPSSAAAVVNPEAADEAAAAAVQDEQEFALSPRPLSAIDDSDDWGPDGEEEFMSMLNLMEEQDAEMSRTTNAEAIGMELLGMDTEDSLADATADDTDGIDASDRDFSRSESGGGGGGGGGGGSGGGLLGGNGSRNRRKHFIESLEKAEMDMDRDLAAREEENRLALELKEQWQRKMKAIAHGILRKWWGVGGHAGSSGGGSGGGVDRSGWKDLVTDDVVALAPVEEGGFRHDDSAWTATPPESASVGDGGQEAVFLGALAPPPPPPRATERRMEGPLAVEGEAEKLRVMMEILGQQTAAGNVKLKLELHVDHWALGERELMCQWRIATRNADMCGGRRDLQARGMMALRFWTSEDGEAPSVEPKTKSSTWSILCSPPAQGLAGAISQQQQKLEQKQEQKQQQQPKDVGKREPFQARKDWGEEAAMRDRGGGDGDEKWDPAASSGAAPVATSPPSSSSSAAAAAAAAAAAPAPAPSSPPRPLPPPPPPPPPPQRSVSLSSTSTSSSWSSGLKRSRVEMETGGG
ncbi:unnamed protein product, partial [Scytosiphon promiscuus]